MPKDINWSWRSEIEKDFQKVKDNRPDGTNTVPDTPSEKTEPNTDARKLSIGSCSALDASKLSIGSFLKQSEKSSGRRQHAYKQDTPAS